VRGEFGIVLRRESGAWTVSEQSSVSGACTCIVRRGIMQMKLRVEYWFMQILKEDDCKGFTGDCVAGTTASLCATTEAQDPISVADALSYLLDEKSSRTSIFEKEEE
jgi:hypothetical protein